MDMNETHDDALDTAAADALGMNSSAAVAEMERDMRETVARLAAASPYAAPPAELRGRILQATAPATFRMEDYRKANRDDLKFYKRGFYAAAVFLAAAALFNITVQRQNATMRNSLAAADKQMTQVQSTLATLVNPTTAQINITDKNGATIARAWANDATKQAVVIMPEEMVASGHQISMSNGNQKYQTTLLTAPASMLNVQAPQGLAIKTDLDVTNKVPDDSNKVYRAGVSLP